MDIDNIRERVDREFRRAINNPDDFNFSERDPYIVEVNEPEHHMFEEANVDLENQNVQVNYTLQDEEENNTCVMYEPTEEIALIKSEAIHGLDGKTVTSTSYYLIDGDDVYTQSGLGWEETIQDRPLTLVERFDELYKQAIEIDNELKTDLKESQSETGPKPVPPPDESFFTE